MIRGERPGFASDEGGKGDGNDNEGRERGECESEREEKGKERVVRKTVLLSCTHVFHDTCLQTLEELSMGEVKSSCPVCRTPYQKRIIAL